MGLRLGRVKLLALVAVLFVIDLATRRVEIAGIYAAQASKAEVTNPWEDGNAA